MVTGIKKYALWVNENGVDKGVIFTLNCYDVKHCDFATSVMHVYCPQDNTEHYVTESFFARMFWPMHFARYGMKYVVSELNKNAKKGCKYYYTRVNSKRAPLKVGAVLNRESKAYALCGREVKVNYFMDLSSPTGSFEARQGTCSLKLRNARREWSDTLQ